MATAALVQTGTCHSLAPVLPPRCSLEVQREWVRYVIGTEPAMCSDLTWLRERESDEVYGRWRRVGRKGGGPRLQQRLHTHRDTTFETQAIQEITVYGNLLSNIPDAKSEYSDCWLCLIKPIIIICCCI